MDEVEGTAEGAGRVGFPGRRLTAVDSVRCVGDGGLEAQVLPPEDTVEAGVGRKNALRRRKRQTYPSKADAPTDTDPNADMSPIIEGDNLTDAENVACGNGMPVSTILNDCDVELWSQLIEDAQEGVVGSSAEVVEVEVQSTLEDDDVHQRHWLESPVTMV